MGFRNVTTLGLALSLALLSVDGPAWADPPGPNTLPITVTTIKTEESDALADALTSALKAQVRNSKGWSLADGDYSLEVLTLALRCPTPPDAACELRIADKIKTDRFIWGTIDEKDGKAVGSLHLWTRGRGETSVPLSYSANLTEPQDEALIAVVRKALETLTGGPPKGEVVVKADDVNGQVFVDDKPAGAVRDGKATIYVPVGEHTIEVRAPGYSSASSTVTVKPEGSIEVKLALVPKEEEGDSGALREVAVYGAFGLSGAFLIAGVASSLHVWSIDNKNRDYRDEVQRGLPDRYKNKSMCEAARDAEHDENLDPAHADAFASIRSNCDSAQPWEVLQFVFYGLSAASLGAGAYLVLTDDSQKHADDSHEVHENRQQGSVVVVPTVGKNAGSLSLKVTF